MAECACAPAAGPPPGVMLGGGMCPGLVCCCKWSGWASDELEPAELMEHMELFREPTLEPPGDEGGVL